MKVQSQKMSLSLMGLLGFWIGILYVGARDVCREGGAQVRPKGVKGGSRCMDFDLER